MAVQSLAGSSPVVSSQAPSPPASAAPVTPPAFPHTDTFIQPKPASAPEPQLAPVDSKRPVPASLGLERVHALLADLAPQVREATGWPLDLAQVGVSLTNPGALKGSLLADKRQRTGVSDAVWSAVESREADDLGSLNTVIGRYLPGAQALLLVPANFPLVNGDKLRMVLFDLLVRAAQQQQNPQFFAALHQAEHAALEAHRLQGPNHKETRQLRRVATGRHCWLVAHAETLLKRAKSDHFPHAQPKVSLRRALKDGVALLQKPLWKRQLLQFNGPKAYACVEARNEVDAFYASPERVDALMKGCTRRFNPEKNLQNMAE